MTPSTQPNAALTEILAKTGELDRILDGRGLTFEPAARPPAAPALPRPPLIPPWTDPRDASSYVEPEPVATEEIPSPQPPPRRAPVDTGRPPTPRFDQAHAWRAEQLRGDGS